MEYDVVIAGGGIGGLYCARELAKKGATVLLVEKSETPGEPNYSTAGTPVQTLEEFELDPKSIADTITRLAYGTIYSEHIWNSTTPIGYVLDFRKTKEILAAQAQKTGGTIVWGEQVITPIIENDKTIGIQTTKRKIYGKYYIDATGSRRVLLNKYEPANDSKKNPSIGIEKIIIAKDSTFKQYKNSMAVYFDVSYSPYGYFWIFSNGNNTYKLGLCEGEADPRKPHHSLEERLTAFIEKKFGKCSYDEYEVHGGSVWVTNKINRYVYKNVLGIGDSIGMINPLLGEGIRHSLYSANIAVNEILKSIKNNSDLNGYEKQIKEYKSNKWRLMELIGTGLYRRNSKYTQRFYEEFVKFGENVGVKEACEFSFDYNVLPILKTFPKNIPLVKAFLLSYLAR